MESTSTPAGWQSDSCPPWCVREHLDTDHPDDRYHDSASTEVAAIFAVRDRDAGPGQWALDPGAITIVTSQHDASTSVTTFVGRADRRGQSMTMTPDTAARLAEALAQHVKGLREGS